MLSLLKYTVQVTQVEWRCYFGQYIGDDVKGSSRGRFQGKIPLLGHLTSKPTVEPRTSNNRIKIVNAIDNLD
jgi:hypothetical protein